MENGRRVKISPPLEVAIKPEIGTITHDMYKLGQVNAGPEITEVDSYSCSNISQKMKTSCFCCSKLELLQEADNNRSAAKVKCIYDSNTWYNLYAAGKTYVDQNLTGELSAVCGEKGWCASTASIQVNLLNILY